MQSNPQAQFIVQHTAEERAEKAAREKEAEAKRQLSPHRRLLRYCTESILGVALVAFLTTFVLLALFRPRLVTRASGTMYVKESLDLMRVFALSLMASAVTMLLGFGFGSCCSSKP